MWARRWVLLLAFVAPCVAIPASGQRVSGPDPEAMAILCTVTRAWAANDGDLLVLGCSPDVAALPPGRQPCELRARGHEPVWIRFDATGHMSAARHDLVFDEGRLPIENRFDNDARGIVAIHGSNVESTVRREAGAVTLISVPGDGESSHVEARFESGPSGLTVVESALVGRDWRDVSARWESTVTGRIRHSTDSHGRRAELEWDASGRPIRYLTADDRDTPPTVHEVRYTWNASGQLTAQTPHGSLVNPTEILYRCDAPPR